MWKPVTNWVGSAALALLAAAAPGVAEEADFHARVGEVVTLRGEARAGKAGAVVVTPEGPIYVAGLHAWPAELRDRSVEATGRLARHEAEPLVDAAGMVRQGIAGPWYSLEDASWRLPPERR